MTDRTALVVLSVDGIVSLETGVGVVVSSFVEQFTSLVKALGIDSPVSLVCITPKLKGHATGWRSDVLERALAVCTATGGRIVEISSRASGDTWHGLYHEGPGYTQIEQWEALSRAGAEAAETLLDEYDRVIAIGHDTPFARVGAFLGPRTEFIWVPHILAAPLPNFVGSVQHKFELDGIEAILSQTHRVGYVSSYIKECLTNLYSIPLRNQTPFINGVSETSGHFQQSENERNKLLEMYRIPSGRKLLFFSGRFHPVKGPDLVLPAIEEFLDSEIGSAFYPVILMPTGTLRDDYKKQLESHIEKLRNRGTVILAFDQLLPFAILKSGDLQLAVFSSRYESGPLAPMETLFFADSTVKIVYTPIDAYRHLFEGQPNTFAAKEVTSTAISNALAQAAKAVTSLEHRQSPPTFFAAYLENLRAIFD